VRAGTEGKRLQITDHFSTQMNLGGSFRRSMGIDGTETTRLETEKFKSEKTGFRSVPPTGLNHSALLQKKRIEKQNDAPTRKAMGCSTSENLPRIHQSGLEKTP